MLAGLFFEFLSFYFEFAYFIKIISPILLTISNELQDRDSKQARSLYTGSFNFSSSSVVEMGMPPRELEPLFWP